jgi:hypothetical protein
VDAVCIDQTDDHEKIIQIRLLQSIFQKAEKVFAWIGEEKDNSNRVVEFLLQIRTLTVNPDEWPRDLPPISSSWFKNTLTLDEVIWDEVSLFFQRDWFHRVWVVQELVLASKVRIVCGRWDVNWDDIFSALETCLKIIGTMRLPNLSLRKFVTHAKPAYALGLTRRLFKDPRLSIRFNLLSLLDMFAHTEATKERDKLFALLGLASDAGDEIFNPNYTSSLESVVRRYANEFSQRGNAMDLLYRAGTSKSYRFCSWIPRWTGGEPCRTISTWHGAKGSFSAGANSCTESQPLLLEQNKLQVFGAAIDIIDFLCPTTTNERDIIYVVNDIHATIDKLEAYPTGESHKELKFQVPIGNTTTPCFDDIGTLEILRTETRNEDHTFRWTEEFSAINSVQEMVDFVKQPRNTREKGWKYWRTAAAFAKRLSNGRFCVTRRGYVGFVPDDAKLGDVVCVIHGGAVSATRDWNGGYNCCFL